MKRETEVGCGVDRDSWPEGSHEDAPFLWALKEKFFSLCGRKKVDFVLQDTCALNVNCLPSAAVFEY